MMQPRAIAVVGVAETTRISKVPELSQLDLSGDAALNALADAGLKPSDIEGTASAGDHWWKVAAMLGIAPKWLTSTSVGGGSRMLHVPHAAAACSSCPTT